MKRRWSSSPADGSPTAVRCSPLTCEPNRRSFDNKCTATDEKNQADYAATLETDPPAAVSTAIRPRTGNAPSSAAAARARSPSSCRPARGAATSKRTSATKPHFPPAARDVTAARSSIGVYCAWCYGPGLRRRVGARIHRPALRRPLPQSEMRPPGFDALHALLPVVPDESPPDVENPGSTETCGKCGWGVLREFWSHCPWCTSAL